MPPPKCHVNRNLILHLHGRLHNIIVNCLKLTSDQGRPYGHTNEANSKSRLR